jgi:hypothetical protein
MGGGEAFEALPDDTRHLMAICEHLRWNAVHADCDVQARGGVRMRGYTIVRVVASGTLALFGFVMGGIAWDELVGRITVPDAFMILFFGLPAFFASMAWLARHLETLLPETTDGQPRWMVGELAALVFFIPGGAMYIARSALRASRGATDLAWLAWAASCTGMQISMITELSGASPTTTFDGLYAAFGVLNALSVVTLMWTPPRTPQPRVAS